MYLRGTYTADTLEKCTRKMLAISATKMDVIDIWMGGHTKKYFYNYTSKHLGDFP